MKSYLQQHWFPLGLFALYLAVFAALGVHPYSRPVWYAENAPIFGIVAVLFILYVKGIRFSKLSYFLMSFLIFMHTVGGHYTFERVPFDWFTNFFGFARNHYDRIAHFTVGFYVFPILELLNRGAVIRKRWVMYLFPIFAIMALAAGYEIFEWIYAVSGDPTAGIAVLGSQGDVWDAQKDMLADTLGALAAALLFALTTFLKKKSTNAQQNLE